MECYKRHGVKFKNPQYNYLCKDLSSRKNIDNQQHKARELAEYLMQGRNLVYVDESTFNKWQMKNKAWVKRGMWLSMPSKRGVSLTVIGALS